MTTPSASDVSTLLLTLALRGELAATLAEAGSVASDDQIARDVIFHLTAALGAAIEVEANDQGVDPFEFLQALAVEWHRSGPLIPPH